MYWIGMGEIALNVFILLSDSLPFEPFFGFCRYLEHNRKSSTILKNSVQGLLPAVDCNSDS